MVIYFTLKNGYVNGWGTTPSGEGNEIKLEVDKDHEVLHNPEIFKYENGELIKDEERQKKLKRETEKEENRPTGEEINEMALLELAELVAKTMKGGD